jgi:hypothetical protein
MDMDMVTDMVMDMVDGMDLQCITRLTILRFGMEMDFTDLIDRIEVMVQAPHKQGVRIIYIVIIREYPREMLAEVRVQGIVQRVLTDPVPGLQQV